MNRGLDLSIRVMRNHQPEGKISRSRWYDILKRDTLSAARFFLSLSLLMARRMGSRHIVAAARWRHPPSHGRPTHEREWESDIFTIHAFTRMDQTYWNDQIKKGSQERESHLVGYARISFLFFMFLYAAAQTTPGLRAPFQVSSLKKKKRKKEKSPNSSSFLSSFLYIFIHIPFFSLSLSFFSLPVAILPHGKLPAHPSWHSLIRTGSI